MIPANQSPLVLVVAEVHHLGRHCCECSPSEEEISIRWVKDKYWLKEEKSSVGRKSDKICQIKIGQKKQLRGVFRTGRGNKEHRFRVVYVLHDHANARDL